MPAPWTETGHNISNRDIHTNCQGNIYLIMWHNISSKTQKPLNECYKHATELSKYIWNLKDKNVKYTIKWHKVKQAKLYTNVTRK